MDNSRDEESTPGGKLDPMNAPRPRSLFGDDDAAPRPESPRRQPAAVARQQFKLFTWVLLPAAILLVGIATIAWITQNLPNTRTITTTKPDANSPDAIRFNPAIFIWDPDSSGQPKNPKYLIPEFELGQPGHYDYQFTNTSDGDVDLGVAQTSCTCSGISVCLFRSKTEETAYLKDKDSSNLTWTKMEIDKEFRNKVTVPPKAAGALRIAWTGAKTEPERLRLVTKVWHRASHGQDVRVKDLQVLANYVHPAKFLPDKADMGTIGPKDQRTRKFLCWSATRELDVTPAGDDPLIKIEVSRLKDEEREKLAKEMLDNDVMTRVLSAYYISVTLSEQNRGKQLDLGLFVQPIPLTITSQGQPVDVPLPTIRAAVLGEVSLGPEAEGGLIDFRVFSAKLGTSKKITLLAPKEAQLSFVGCDPALLDVEAVLKKLKMVGEKSQWQMEVTAKPNRDPGLLPPNGVVILQYELPAVASQPAVKRQVRIHVTGTAESRH